MNIDYGKGYGDRVKINIFLQWKVKKMKILWECSSLLFTNTNRYKSEARLQMAGHFLLWVIYGFILIGIVIFGSGFIILAAQMWPINEIVYDK